MTEASKNAWSDWSGKILMMVLAAAVAYFSAEIRGYSQQLDDYATRWQTASVQLAVLAETLVSIEDKIEDASTDRYTGTQAGLDRAVMAGRIDLLQQRVIHLETEVKGLHSPIPARP